MLCDYKDAPERIAMLFSTMINAELLVEESLTDFINEGKCSVV